MASCKRLSSRSSKSRANVSEKAGLSWEENRGVHAASVCKTALEDANGAAGRVGIMTGGGATGGLAGVTDEVVPPEPDFLCFFEGHTPG